MRFHMMNISELLVKYREAAEGTGHTNPRIANKLARRLHNYYKQLHETEEGRAGIAQLMSDANVHVRCWAAAHSLQWESKIARSVLEAIRDQGDICSFTAEWTLKRFDEGKLSFDY